MSLSEQNTVLAVTNELNNLVYQNREKRQPWSSFDTWRECYSESALAVRDHFIRKQQAKKDYRWVTRVNRGFWMLEHIYPFNSQPVQVTEWVDFSPNAKENWNGRPDYLDIHIRVPWIGLNHFPSMRMPWIFTVESVRSFMLYKSTEDAQTELWWNSREKEILLLNLDNPANFWGIVKPKLNNLLSNPIVEFDQVWTNQADFGKDDVIKYARVWLSKFYPNLAKREIVFVEP